jgi:oleate hydratase
MELAEHLRVSREFMLSNSITIPRVMSRLAAPLLTRASEDRPHVSPDKTNNLAVVGQFIDMPDETCATVDYSIRGAYTAVNQLIGLDGAQ